MRIFAIMDINVNLYIFFWKLSMIKIFDVHVTSKPHVNPDLLWHVTRSLILDFSHILLGLASHVPPF